MFRKTASIIAAICIMTSLTACGGKDSKNTTSNEPYQSNSRSGRDTESGIRNGIDDAIDGVEDGINGVEEGIDDAIDSVTPSSNRNSTNSMR